MIILFLIVVENYKKKRKIEYCQQKVAKALREMKLFEQWLFVKQEGKQLSDYFLKKKINSIAIYGMGNIGERLYDELRDQGVMVKYAVDQKGKRICSDIEVVPDFDMNILEKVDAIVVTTVHCYEDIRTRVASKTNIPVISLEEILYEI